MLRDRMEKLFIDQDYNCAESMLHAANDKYGLGIDKDAFKLVGGYGGGIYSEKTCGALLGSVAAISCFLIKERAHEDDAFKETICAFRDKFMDKFGTDQCGELKPVWRPDDEIRCLPLLLEVSDLLEEEMLELRAKPVK